MQAGDTETVETFGELYESRFLKACDVGAKPTYTIARVYREVLDGKNGLEKKTIVSFSDHPKPLVANKTNGLCLQRMFGDELADWLGKRVTLYEGVTESGPEKGKPSVRVWGSPDIAKDTDLVIAFPKKTPFTVRLHRTGQAPAADEPLGERAQHLKGLIGAASALALLEAVGDEIKEAAKSGAITGAELKALRGIYTKRKERM